MAKSAQEFIQSSFSPIIAVLCSPKVNNLVSKNNLTFSELLQPFASMDWEGQFREPGGSLCTVKNWKLIIRDVNWKPLQPTEARRQLNNAVLHNFDDKTSTFEFDGRRFDVPKLTPWFDAWRETYLEVQFPSDHEFTKHFLSCIIVATTLDENIVDTYNQLNQQYAQLQNVAPPKLPKWFNNGVLKSYLLLHDVSTVSKEKADATFETVKQAFGTSNCFMLTINSKSLSDPKLLTDYWAQYITRSMESYSEMSSPVNVTTFEPQAALPQTNIVTPEDKPNIVITSTQEGVHPLTATENDVYDNANSLQTYSFSGSSESVNVAGKGVDYSNEVHGAALNTNDIEAIKKFLQEYASKALLPYLEKQISQLSEVVANRKGVSRSLLSATKRWFATGKPGNTTGNNTVIYSSDCPELQLRRLGDLWFLCGQWQRAFDAYHTAKREFYADSAWLCYAGALEMAAISAFMAGEANRKTHGYMEESIVTYLNTCRMVQYAVRATLLSALCLINSGLHGEAAKQLIRMTSEDSDLRSAMLLEQASLCFLSGPGTKAMCRKYAFHMVLAGHRFSKAGQKKHAYRCYHQAYQVYTGSGWRLATDHVQFALGRLAGALKQAVAPRWLAAPLAPSSPQPPPQQAAFLREYMLAHQQWIESSDEFGGKLPVVPVPLVVRGETRVSCAGPAPLAVAGRVAAGAPPSAPHAARVWHRLEEMLIQAAQGAPPMIFKPTVDLYTEDTDANPIVPQGEPIQVTITLTNPLKIPLLLKDLELLWQFIPNTENTNVPKDILDNEPFVASGRTLDSNVISRQKIQVSLLEGECNKRLTFSLTPLQVGRLHIKGLAYKLTNTGEDGKENNNSIVIMGKLELSTAGNDADKRLQIMVIPQAPCLQMTFSEINPEVISGELRTIDVEFRNVGPVEMKNLYVAVSHPDCLSLVTDEPSDDFSVLYEEKYQQPPVYQDERAARAGRRANAVRRHTRLVSPALGAAANVRARLLLRPRQRVPALRLLAYYETTLPQRPHRLLRHEMRLQPMEAIEIQVTPRRSLNKSDEDMVENMSLAVEVKNVCKENNEDIAIEVLEVSLISQQWTLTDFIAAPNMDAALIPRERIHYVFKAKRIFAVSDNSKVECSHIKVAAKRCEETDADVKSLPYSKFLMDCLPSTDDLTDPNYSETETKRDGLIQSLLVVRWKAHDKVKSRTALGQHCLWINCFSKALSQEKELSPELPIQLDDLESKNFNEPKDKSDSNNIVLFRLEHSNYVNHNFKQRKLCMIPIVINIVNCYGIPVSVFIDMTKQQNRESTSELGWAGALSAGPDVESKSLGVHVTLQKLESRRVHVLALCAAPGTYVLGSAFTLTTSCGLGTHATTHFSNNTSLLVVRQAA
ncbi:PREDICTED: trafficking protein particle complex subunit 8 [Papilio xuthus]|uniref:Trafficking protein particle complex subunit 8 n=1 Tax=Papilio xuthus TaxID=66420 RepID=A0AAJ6ZMH1_PAPXU|nr:PREDICTED: trafficking protein particle complex subunit 8 [Papilio xuthus]